MSTALNLEMRKIEKAFGLPTRPCSAMNGRRLNARWRKCKVELAACCAQVYLSRVWIVRVAFHGAFGRR